LVRKTVESISRVHLLVSDHSFVRGLSETECREFVDEIITEKVDIAIFDENLDYERTSLSGTVLGERCRDLGFKGCMILHTANAHESDYRSDIFDGILPKTASRKLFIQGVEKAWNKYKAK
jgi:hypothetical protein